MRHFLHSFPITAAAIFTFVGCTHRPLSDARKDIIFPEYTKEDKQLVANQVDLIFRELYVNRERKMETNGAQVDPIPLAAALKRDATKVSTADLQTRTQAIFKAQRDLHLNFTYPAPYSCYTTFVPVDFDKALNENITEFFVTVSAKSKDGYAGLEGLEDHMPADAIASADAELLKISVGDVVVSYNGQYPWNAVKSLQGDGAGANKSAYQSRAIQLLTVHPGDHMAPPKGDILQLTMRRPDGSTYQVNLPWISQEDTMCSGRDAQENMTASGEKLPMETRLHLSADKFQLHLNTLKRDVFGVKAEFAGQEYSRSADIPSLSWTTFKNRYGKFGVLKLDDFMPPQGKDWDDYVNEAVRIVRDELKDTRGLVIDVRENGGGHIFIADRLAQIFTANTIEPATARFLNTPLNRYIMTKSPYFVGTQWEEAARAAKPGDKYSPTVGFSSIEEANNLGQFYFGRVAVLTNGNCYSACDLFSTSFQDSRIGPVIGEDDIHTGAGGANVIDYATFQDILKDDPNSPFVDLPGSQGMRVSWRQSVRGGYAKGELIEDTGVVSDLRVYRTIEDVVEPDSKVFDRVSEELVEQDSIRQKRGSIYFRTYTPDVVKTGQQLTLPAEVSNVDRIDYFAGGRKIGSQQLRGVTNGAVTLQIPTAALKAGAWNVELKGHARGHMKWRVIRNVTVGN